VVNTDGMVEPGLGQPIGSILVADCGSSFTRASLLERVETGYCFVAHATAPTTAEPPWSDVSMGVRHAIEQITHTTGRVMLDDHGMLIIPELGGQGADLFVLTSSVGEPLRVVLAGLVSQVSLASLVRAAASSYTQVLGLIARDYVGLPTDGETASRPAHETPGLSDEDRIALIRQQQPDAVWVGGGIDGGSREPVRDLVETVALACTLVDKPPQPKIFYAGNAELRSDIVELVGEEVKLEIIDNVRPTLDVENLTTARAAFQTAYVQHKIQHVPGMGNLIGWSGAPVLPTAQALGYLVTYLERLYHSGKGVLCADVGSAATAIAADFPAALATGSADKASESGHVESLDVIPDLGVGYGAPALLKRVGVDAITRWLPFEPEPGEVEQVLLNKGVRPITVPQDRRGLLIEQAAVREALRLVMGRAREGWRASLWSGGGETRYGAMPLFEPIIACGGSLVHAPRLGQTVLMLLDAIEPVGITTLVLDEHGVASALGAVAVTQPLAAVQALDADAFLTLGTVVAPIGRARPGEVIMRVKITFDSPTLGAGGGGELEMEVKYGSLEVLPLRLGEKARLELKPRRGIHLGQAGRVVEVNGGAVGLVIDARGRPLRLPYDPEACRRQVQQWLWDMGV